MEETGKISYRVISSLEAMSLIDQNKTNNLYFVEIYHESPYPYGNDGRTIRCITHGDLRQTEPIKYKSLVTVRTGKIFTPFKEIEAEPGKVIIEKPNRKYSGHRWVLKEECLEFYTNPPFRNIRR